MKSLMTCKQLREALDELGITQVGFARFIGVDERTVRSWVGGLYPVPRYVEILVDLLKNNGEPLEEITHRLAVMHPPPPPRRRNR